MRGDYSRIGDRSLNRQRRHRIRNAARASSPYGPAEVRKASMVAFSHATMSLFLCGGGFSRTATRTAVASPSSVICTTPTGQSSRPRGISDHGSVTRHVAVCLKRGLRNPIPLVGKATRERCDISRAPCLKVPFRFRNSAASPRQAEAERVHHRSADFPRAAPSKAGRRAGGAAVSPCGRSPVSGPPEGRAG